LKINSKYQNHSSVKTIQLQLNRIGNIPHFRYFHHILFGKKYADEKAAIKNSALIPEMPAESVLSV